VHRMKYLITQTKQIPKNLRTYYKDAACVFSDVEMSSI